MQEFPKTHTKQYRIDNLTMILSKSLARQIKKNACRAFSLLKVSKKWCNRPHTLMQFFISSQTAECMKFIGFLRELHLLYKASTKPLPVRLNLITKVAL